MIYESKHKAFTQISKIMLMNIQIEHHNDNIVHYSEISYGHRNRAPNLSREI